MAHPVAPDPHHAAHDRASLAYAVVTVSDTRTLADDHSGQVVVEALDAAGHRLVARRVVPDETAAIVGAVRDAVDAGARLVVTNGGTGIAPRDVTYEAIAGLLDKTLEGFGEAFRRLSWDEIGPRAVLSRALAGTYGGALVVALPGSTKGVRLGIERLVIPLAPHAVGLLG